MVDIGNANLNVDFCEKVYTISRPEFGSIAGKYINIIQALYGLKSAGAAWRAHLASAMIDLSFKPCQVDPDFWMKSAVKPDSTE